MEGCLLLFSYALNLCPEFFGKRKMQARETGAVAYLSPMNFRQLYPGFASEIGEKSAPVEGLNDVFGRFR